MGMIIFRKKKLEEIKSSVEAEAIERERGRGRKRESRIWPPLG